MRFLRTTVLAAMAGVLLAGAAWAQDIPREAFKAKTYYIVNKTGKPAVENGADSEMSKWGRLTMADDADSADIKIVLTKAGSSTTTGEKLNGAGTGFESSTSTSLTFGIDLHAYLKGQGIYFYQTNSASSGEKGGRNVIDNFRKQFPRE